MHIHWTPQQQPPVHTAPLVATSRRPTTTASASAVEASRPDQRQTEKVILHELHMGLARGLGSSLLDALYRGTAGPADPVAIRRVSAMEKIQKWIHTTNGEVLIKMVEMVEASQLTEALQADTAAMVVTTNTAGEHPLEEVRNAVDRPVGGGRAGTGSQRKKRHKEQSQPKPAKRGGSGGASKGGGGGANKPSPHPHAPPAPAPAPAWCLPPQAGLSHGGTRGTAPPRMPCAQPPPPTNVHPHVGQSHLAYPCQAPGYLPQHPSPAVNHQSGLNLLATAVAPPPKYQPFMNSRRRERGDPSMSEASKTIKYRDGVPMPNTAPIRGGVFRPADIENFPDQMAFYRLHHRYGGEV